MAAVVVMQHVVGLEEDVVSQEFVEEKVGISSCSPFFLCLPGGCLGGGGGGCGGG